MGYDGGDCCKKSLGKPVNKKYCKQCKCLDPKNKDDANCKGHCKYAAYKGDGNCDDENNNCGCGYDGGDCCKLSLGKPVNKKYCKKCECIDPKNKASANCKGTCKYASYKGDGNCDDKTTTAVASTTAVIAARKHQKTSLLLRNTAKNASVLIPTTKKTTKKTTNPNVTQAKINVVRQTTKAMETVTTSTTTVVVLTTAVIAARKHSRRQLSKNTAKSACAWIQPASKLCFFNTRFFFLNLGTQDFFV